MIEDAIAKGEESKSKTNGLPTETQNYIDNRIHDATERVRDQLERRTQEIIKERLRWWDKLQNQLGIIGILVGIVSFVGMRDFLRKRAEQAALDYLTTNVVHQAMMATFQSNVTVFTQSHLEPLQKQVLQSSNAVFAIRQQIEQDQLALQRRVRLQEAYLGARIGSLRDYQELSRFSRESDEVGSLAKGAREEVDRFFQSFLNSPEKRIIVDGITLKPRLMSVEEVIWFLSDSDAGNRIAAATTLTQLALTNTVGSICRHVEIETNLFVVTQLIGMLRHVTGVSIGILDTESVGVWWATNRINPAFQASYDDFLAVAYPKTGNAVLENSVVLKKVSEALIAEEPNACYARYNRARTLLNGGRLAEAEQEILEIDKRLPNYSFNIELKVEINYRRKQTNEAISALNQLFEARVSAADDFVTSDSTNFFRDFLTDPRIKWPPHIIRRR
jgi:hypothetical protein